uniref:NADH dehydrogenase [ubiquinone] 1 beta subcomplex subunit 10 n=1 Tax=Pogona vitticeps TaxID=103695 RepID=A0ABM5F100_9SAUR
MPEEPDWEGYPPESQRRPEREKGLNPVYLLEAVYSQVVDRPVTLWREWIERQRANNRIYYYHRKFRRVPELTECLEDDVVCHYEAEMQWKRDFLVDQQILKIIKDRVGHCKALHGENADQKCVKEVQHYKDVIKIYWNKYGDLGAYGTARKCLMKQKEQMIAERKARKAAEAEVAAEE